MVSRVVFQPLCSLSLWQVEDVGASKNDNSQAFEAGTVPKQVCYFHLNLGRLKKHLRLSPEQQVLSRKYSLCPLQKRDSLGCGSRRNSLKGLLNQELTLLLISVVRWWAMWCNQTLDPQTESIARMITFCTALLKRTLHTSTVCFIPKTRISHKFPPHCHWLSEQ